MRARMAAAALRSMSIFVLMPSLVSMSESAGQSPACPSTCASLGMRQFKGSPAVSVQYRTVTACRRACVTNNFTYYAYTADQQCSCYSSCTGTVSAAGSKKLTIGVASVCRDAVCPTTCASGASTSYITSPGPTYTVLVSSITACQATCKPIGPYYVYTTAGTCSCYLGCMIVKKVPSSVPARVGKVSACTQTAPGFKCSSYVRTRPRCGANSEVVQSTGLDLKVRYQCCCAKGRTPLILKNRFLGCK